MNRIEIIVWTTWVPNDDELKELRKAVGQAVPATEKAWVETDFKEGRK